MPISQLQSAKAIWYKLLWFCYYYARFSGMVVFGVKQCKQEINRKRANFKMTVIHNTDVKSFKDSKRQKCLGKELTLLRAHVSNTLLGLHILIRLILCLFIAYFVLKFRPTENILYNSFIYCQLVLLFVYFLIVSIVEISYKERLVEALSAFIRLIREVEELHHTYEIYRWTHVTFATLKAFIIFFEFIHSWRSVFAAESFTEVIQRCFQRILVCEAWLNIHAVTLLYVTIEALYDGLNHYMRHEFIPRLRTVQTFGQITTDAEIDRLTKDMARFMDLFKRVQRVGSELHYTLVSMYINVISGLYYIAWQYFEEDVVHVRFIHLISKLIADTLLLALAAHKAIKSSQLIGCMGLENVMLVENDKWHKQMDHFLYHINLYELKFNFLGLFDISNAATLSFFSGILTAISIFPPFIIKNDRLKKILEQKN